MSTLGPLRLTLTALSLGLILIIPTVICWALYEVNTMFSPGPAKAGVPEHFLGERIYGTTGIRRYSQIHWSVSWPIAVRIWLCSEIRKLELLRPSSSNLPGWWTTQRQKLVNFHYDPRFLRQQLLHCTCSIYFTSPFSRWIGPESLNTSTPQTSQQEFGITQAQWSVSVSVSVQWSVSIINTLDYL